MPAFGAPASENPKEGATAAAPAAPTSASPDFGSVDRPLGGGLMPARILQLQRQIGNRATVAALQRNPEADALKQAERAPAADPQAADHRQHSEGGARRWGKLRGEVDESRKFNTPGRKASPVFTSNVRVKAELGPERAAKLQQLIEARAERDALTTTAGGAYLASQVNAKEKIGSSKAYTTLAARDGHLGDFMKGAHAFVSNDAYLKIRGEHATEANFNAWGSGSNFVAPLGDADKLVAEAAAEGGRGLFHLEDKLGIPPGRWVRECKSAGYAIWRFKILKPDALNLRIPSGNEYGAYATWVDKGTAHRGEWRPNGLTAGGAKEAVIDQVGVGKYGQSGPDAGKATRTKLAELVQDGVLEMVLDPSMRTNTERVLAGG